MTHKERQPRASDRGKTIVHPSGLVVADQVSACRSTTAHEPGVFASTAVLADALTGEAAGDRPDGGAAVGGAHVRRYRVAAGPGRRPERTIVIDPTGARLGNVVLRFECR